ncbi:hypothetical protein COEREDRAFT_87513 [Coemansia reversa NRRL 1564]|uniref:Uncharacterized protein n=1 Tax=Coemansia reversa (strain ATCC 12441 / NRRL 1564) TaxID=763665 RepID=A0A2G5B9S5_COERN|nr:hypothetical protein COEREDRAFT_87513 [Coemansia reversa NRRL 1564]|eukprot:PIA15763.1 hypothetical protein COEREDRAFT_87513 [Coemansia reversa NRRL 1564]
MLFIPDKKTMPRIEITTFHVNGNLPSDTICEIEKNFDLIVSQPEICDNGKFCYTGTLLGSTIITVKQLVRIADVLKNKYEYTNKLILPDGYVYEDLYTDAAFLDALLERVDSDHLEVDNGRKDTTTLITKEIGCINNYSDNLEQKCKYLIIGNKHMLTFFDVEPNEEKLLRIGDIINRIFKENSYNVYPSCEICKFCIYEQIDYEEAAFKNLHDAIQFHNYGENNAADIHKEISDKYKDEEVIETVKLDNNLIEIRVINIKCIKIPFISTDDNFEYKISHSNYWFKFSDIRPNSKRINRIINLIKKVFGEDCIEGIKHYQFGCKFVIRKDIFVNDEKISDLHNKLKLGNYGWLNVPDKKVMEENVY